MRRKDSTTSMGSIREQFCYVCILFMDAMGTRSCDLIKSALHNHTILADQVSVTFTDANGEEQVVRGGYQGISDIPVERVTEVSYTMLTSKPHGFAPVTYNFTKTDPRAKRMIPLTANFLKHSGANPDDPFATYRRKSTKRKSDKAWSKRHVTAKDINDEIKRAATAVGLPPASFSSKSYREALATKNQLAGVPEEETCGKAGWKGPAMMHKVYDHSEPIRPVKRGRTEHAASSTRPGTSNNAHLSLKHVALLLTAEDRKALREAQV